VSPAWWRQWSATDEAAVTAALEATGTTELSGRLVEELSGGQRQRVWVAMTLAQETPVLLLDEPTTFLDPAAQIGLLDIVRSLNREMGRSVVMVLHDLNLAARYADHLVVMKDGQVVTQGPPAEVVTVEMLREVFGVEAEVFADPRTGTPLVMPLGLSGAVPDHDPETSVLPYFAADHALSGDVIRT
jgi:iron complex transport system ATP-binding protein